MDSLARDRLENGRAPVKTRVSDEDHCTRETYSQGNSWVSIHQLLNME